ncbi:MAG: ABC-2 family transporter protein [Fibrobacteres bacterium]|nr:ABC-2 family transporter protein [Fibrobacterota bacterium]
MRAFSLILTYLKVNLMNEAAYRMNFYLQLYTSLIMAATSLGWLGIVFSQTQSINGWGSMELVALVGMFQTSHGLINLVTLPSLWKLLDEIHKGELDFMLLKPADAQLLTSFRQVNIARCADVSIGLATLGYAFYHLRAVLTTESVVLFVLTFASGIILLYSFLFIITTTAFWFTKVNNILSIHFAIFQSARWPTDIYPIPFQRLMTFVFPIIFVVTVPAKALLGRLSVTEIVAAFAVSLLFFVFARLFWKAGLKRYSGASS